MSDELSEEQAAMAALADPETSARTETLCTTCGLVYVEQRHYVTTIVWLRVCPRCKTQAAQ